MLKKTFAVEQNVAAVGEINACDNFQKSCFTCSVVADKPVKRGFVDCEREVLNCRIIIEGFRYVVYFNHLLFLLIYLVDELNYRVPVDSL